MANNGKAHGRGEWGSVAAYSREVLGRPLRWYQAEVAAAIERSVVEGRGLTITVQMARQAGKTELSAHVGAWLLYECKVQSAKCKGEGTVVKVVPAMVPQAWVPMRRLTELLVRSWPEGSWRREGRTAVVAGGARVVFFSGQADASAMGATASLLLEVDDAQDVAWEQFQRTFRPMAAAHNVTTVVYGTTGRSDSVLEVARRENLLMERRDGVRRHFECDWEVCAAENPAYARFVVGELARLGGGHPWFRSEYLVQGQGGGRRLLSFAQQQGLRGAHARQNLPIPECADWWQWMEWWEGKGERRLEDDRRKTYVGAVVAEEWEGRRAVVVLVGETSPPAPLPPGEGSVVGPSTRAEGGETVGQVRVVRGYAWQSGNVGEQVAAL